ncbi:DUF4292 domain-containing protein [Mesonia sp. K7]|uniref:DUF4292 domain-containing protein n=1 Tax=Mesonia sp. K7 TaxID=2218606 RepID=UPI000DA79D87|nr:DUF4292 domain-containing protein [Mesonia sp. K7]PZD79073.1 DUF4292 domain-containing protein [Mesonia sp. K7]
MIRKIGLIICSFLFLVSCGAKKKLPVGEVADNVSTKTLVKAHKDAEVDFRTLQARVRGAYKSEDDEQSIAIALRMEKDQAIWLSAKLGGVIPLAKAYITPGKVQFYEKINQEYFDGDFLLLTDWLGTDLDFEKVQNMFLGQSIYDLNDDKFSQENTPTAYVLKSKNEIVQKEYHINPSHYLLDKQIISRKLKNQTLTITYANYQKVGEEWFPYEIKIIAQEDDKTTQIEIDYRQIETNVEVTFPFEIPNGYEEIKIDE